MRRSSGGFSLIELVVAVAIIGILTSVAVPTYMRYVARAKTTAGKAELGALQVNFEDAVSQGKTAPTLTDIGLSGDSAMCTFSLTNNQDGSAVLACALVNAPYFISGGVVSYIRSSAGAWTCQVNASIGTDYAPKGCTVGS